MMHNQGYATKYTDKLSKARDVLGEVFKQNNVLIFIAIKTAKKLFQLLNTNSGLVDGRPRYIRVILLALQ